MIRCTFEDNGVAALRHATVNAILFAQTEILLIKRAPFLHEGGKLGLPGGFVDRDETLTQAVMREVQEETGYQCTVKYLFRINDAPVWRGDDRQNIDFIFVADLGEKIGEPDKEVTEVLRYDLEHLPAQHFMAFDHFAHLQKYHEFLQANRAWPLPILG